jgi:hypothetical protein
MEKISAKGIAYALVPVLLLQLTSLVGAVDIIFYESTSQCSGSGYAFNGIAEQTCCVVSAQDGGSVLVTSASSNTASRFYRGGSCANQVGTGSGNYCLLGGQFTGAYWYSARRRSLLGDAGSVKCDSQMKPTGVVYTEDASQGHWMLTCSDAAELFSQMKNVTDAEKANWLITRGATYILL